jgi:hypothetical protein
VDLRLALDVFWNTFSSVMADSTVSKNEVIEVEVRVCKALFDPDEWSLDDAVKAAEEDWDRDVKNGGSNNRMAKTAFEDSIFETIDLWTEGVTAEEYVDFATKLHDRITTENNEWAELADIQSLWSEAPMLPSLEEEEEEEKQEEEDEEEEEEDDFVAPLPTERIPLPQPVPAAEHVADPISQPSRPAPRVRRRTTVKLDMPLNPGG